MDLWQLIATKLSGNASKNDAQELDQLLNQNISNADALTDATQIWADCEHISFVPNVDTDAVWEKVSEQLNTVPQKQIVQKSNRMVWRMAAAVALLLGLSMLYFSLFTTEQQVAKAVAPTQLTLPDGSFAELNKGGELRYPEKFSAKQREIYFEGEGFFSIERNEAKPFVITTQLARITVLGTAFYVKSNTKGEVEVLVEEGSVKLESLDSKQFIVLKAGEQGIFSATNNELIKTECNENRKAWKTGILTFENTPLKEVLSELSVFYNVQFEVQNPSLYDKKFNAQLKRENFEDILQILQLTLNVNIEKHNNAYRLIQKSELQN